MNNGLFGFPPSGGNTSNWTFRQLLTSGTSWTCPVSGWWLVRLQAGGGSGRSDANVVSQGGEAGMFRQELLYFTAGQQISYVIGAGGTSVTVGNGVNGGNTRFGSFGVSGGLGGQSASAVNSKLSASSSIAGLNIFFGGFGGGGGIAGGAFGSPPPSFGGFGSQTVSSATGVAAGQAGGGGDSYYGGGGPGSNSTATPSPASTAYGAGGGANTNSLASGAGIQGCIELIRVSA